jgi:hypothetical protein
MAKWLICSFSTTHASYERFIFKVVIFIQVAILEKMTTTWVFLFWKNKINKQLVLIHQIIEYFSDQRACINHHRNHAENQYTVSTTRL